jgi:hypothetical protein
MSDRRKGSEASHDRRRHFRADFDAGAVIHAARMALRGKIVDLSLGGVRIRRTDDSAPCPAPGTPAMIELELGGSGWIAQDGRIQRCELDEIVITFGPLAAEVEDLIEDEVLAAVEATRRPRMIVVDPSAERRRRVADALRIAGCDSYEAATPLEAIDLMERPRNHIRGVAVAENLTQTGADELCDFFAESNPHIKLALIADGTVDAQVGERGNGDRVSRMSNDDTLEISLRGFADSIATRRDR